MKFIGKIKVYKIFFIDFYPSIVPNLSLLISNQTFIYFDETSWCPQIIRIIIWAIYKSLICVPFVIRVIWPFSKGRIYIIISKDPFSFTGREKNLFFVLDIEFLPSGDLYKPVLFYNDFWNMKRDYHPINETTE